MSENGNFAETPTLSESEELTIQRNIGELAMAQSNMLSVDKDLKTIYISSCHNGEGKTKAAVQTAHALSINRARILLIDGNPRASKLHLVYHTPLSPGLMDCLHNEDLDLKQIIRKTKYNNLYLMTFGECSEGRPDLLKGEGLKRLLDKARNDFDYIIVDGHSIIGASDTPLVASELDGVIIVVQCEKTKWEVVQTSTQKLQMLGGKVAGLVLNRRKYYVPRRLYNWL